MKGKTIPQIKIDDRRSSSADAATQQQRRIETSRKIGTGWNSSRKQWHFPDLPDRALMPDVEDVLAAYDAAAATIDYGTKQEARLKAIPAEIDKLRSEHDNKVDAAIKQKKTPPAPPSAAIAELESEAEALQASMSKIRSRAWSERTKFAKTAAPRMHKLLPKAVTDFETALNSIADLMKKLDAEIDNAHNAQGRIRYAGTFIESPKFPVGNMLDEPSADLHDALQHLKLYAAKVRDRL